MSDYPTEWNVRTLAECGRWLSGGTPSTQNSDYWAGEIPWMSSGSLTSFRLFDAERRLTEEGVRNGTREVGPGTILMVVRGMSLKTEFRIGVAMRRMAFGQDCKALVPDEGLNKYFLALAIQSKSRAILEMVDEAGHGTGRLNSKDLFSLEIGIPCRSEQNAIAEVLGALDDKIAANSGLSDAARQTAVAHVSELPLSAHLKDIAELHKRTAVPTQMEAELVRHFSLPAFDAGQGPELVDPKEIKSSKFLIEAPSVLVSKLNPRFSRIWDVPKLTAVPSLSSTEFLVLRPLNQESVELLWAILSRRSFSTELASNVAGTSGSHQRVKPSIVMDAPVADPRQMAPQLKALITSYLQVAAAYDQESSTLGQIRDALLPQLMSGKLRVRDAEKIVSNAV